MGFVFLKSNKWVMSDSFKKRNLALMLGVEIFGIETRHFLVQWSIPLKSHLSINFKTGIIHFCSDCVFYYDACYYDACNKTITGFGVIHQKSL